MRILKQGVKDAFLQPFVGQCTVCDHMVELTRREVLDKCSPYGTILCFNCGLSEVEYVSLQGEPIELGLMEFFKDE